MEKKYFLVSVKYVAKGPVLTASFSVTTSKSVLPVCHTVPFPLDSSSVAVSPLLVRMVRGRWKPMSHSFVLAPVTFSPVVRE